MAATQRDAEITPAFAVPFISVWHADPAPLNQDLRHLFLQREAEGQKYANTRATMRIGSGLYESRFDLFKWPDRPIQRLRDFCWASLYGAVGELNGFNRAVLSKMTGHADAWFHVTRRGGYFGLHNHSMASWSGVYCVDPGAGGGALLSFPNPNATSAMFMDVAVYGLRSPFGFESRDYRLQAGQLLMFPAWLMHQVLPYEGEGERITVAFNAWFKFDGELSELGR